MRLTIIQEDGAVYKDNYVFSHLPMDAVPEAVHALQWYGDKGTIEYDDGAEVTIHSLPAWADTCLELWQAAKDSEDAEKKWEADSDIRDLVNAYHDSVLSIPESVVQAFIASQSFEYISVMPQRRESDLRVIGISIMNMSGTSEDGTAGLLELHQLVLNAKAKGIPVMAWMFSQNSEPADYAAALESIGFTIINRAAGWYCYIPTTLDMAKARDTQIVNYDRNTDINTPVEWNGNVWDADMPSQLNLLGRLMAYQTGIIPDTLTTKWRTADNQDVHLSYDDVKSLSAAVLFHIEAAYENSWTIKSIINTATDPSQLGRSKKK